MMFARLLSLAFIISTDAIGSPSRIPENACDLARHPPSSAMSTSFDVVDGRIYVEAEIDGRGPFRFAVDTGASGIGRLDRSVLGTLRLATSGTANHSDAVRTTTEETTHLTSIGLGGLIKKDVDVITRDYKRHLSKDASFDGILAREFFAGGTLWIDYSARRLTYSAESSLVEQGSLHYDRAFRVPVRIHGKTFEAQLDTGANVTMVVPRKLWQAVSNSPLQAAGTARLSNSSMPMQRGALAGPVEIGASTLPHVEARVSERYPELLIGAHALRNTILVIDQRSQRVAVCPALP